MQNLSYENEFDLHLNELVSKTDFHMKGFALGRRQRQLGNGLLRTTSNNLDCLKFMYFFCELSSLLIAIFTDKFNICITMKLNTNARQ